MSGCAPLAGAARAALVAVAIAAPVAAESDPRSRVVVDLDCRSSLGRTRLTLFANGTVRRREETLGDRRMWLGELAPEEMAAYLARWRAESAAGEGWSSTGWPEEAVEGDWIERCTIEWRLALDEPTRRRGFSRLATLPLALARLLAVADDLRREADLEAHVENLPLDYSPRSGDVLRRVDGTLFRVVAKTDDKRGVELSGVTVPLTIYVLIEELRREFVAVVSSESLPP
jgi:hypothetical protein